MSNSLSEQLRDLRFQHRLDQASLVAAHGDSEVRCQAAAGIIREIAMQRVFDRLTRRQETELLDLLWPMAYPDGDRKRPQAFGAGARSPLQK